MIDYCDHLKELIEAEKPALIDAINENKYYLSQKEHYDVGWEKAKKDFLKNHLNTWADGFKKAYCGYTCSIRDNCSLKDR